MHNKNKKTAILFIILLLLVSWGIGYFLFKNPTQKLKLLPVKVNPILAPANSPKKNLQLHTISPKPKHKKTKHFKKSVKVNQVEKVILTELKTSITTCNFMFAPEIPTATPELKLITKEEQITTINQITEPTPNQEIEIVSTKSMVIKENSTPDRYKLKPVAGLLYLTTNNEAVGLVGLKIEFEKKYLKLEFTSGNNGFFNFQQGVVLGEKLSTRYGFFYNYPGIAFDYQLTNQFSLGIEAYNIGNLKVGLTTQYALNPNTSLDLNLNQNLGESQASGFNFGVLFNF